MPQILISYCRVPHKACISTWDLCCLYFRGSSSWKKTTSRGQMGGWGFLVHLLSAMIICSRIKIIHLASLYLSASLFAAKAIRSALSFLLFTKGGEQEGGDPLSVCKCVWREGQGALSAPVCLGSGVYVYGCLCAYVCVCVSVRTSREAKWAEVAVWCRGGGVGGVGADGLNHCSGLVWGLKCQHASALLSQLAKH